jgi:N-acylglucosamine 2-epimerase
MIEWSYERGWDIEENRGGLLYFLDVEGFSPTQLEWNMKLWWPHCEAMVAYTLLYRHTKNIWYFKRFLVVMNYTLKHFSDSENGEWFGYLDRDGKMS